MNSFLIILPTKIAKFWLICVAPPLKIVKRTKCVGKVARSGQSLGYKKEGYCWVILFFLLTLIGVLLGNAML